MEKGTRIVIDFNECLQDTCLQLEGYEPERVIWADDYVVLCY